MSLSSLIEMYLHPIDGAEIRRCTILARYKRRYGGTPGEVWSAGLGAHNMRVMRRWMESVEIEKPSATLRAIAAKEG